MAVEQARDQERESELDSITMPAPSAWPLVAALGLTLGFAGLVTHAAVSLVGFALFGRGAAGWWHAVLPVEQVERVPVRPAGQRATPVKAVPQAVEHLTVGEGGHRVRIPAEIYPYSAGIKGGIVGGIAMASVAVGYGVIAYKSVWYPINLLAAAAVPSFAQADLEQLRAFNQLGFFVALLSHALLSLFVGLVYAAVLPMLPRHPAVWGGLLAPVLWSGLVWACLGIIDPTLNTRIDWAWFIASQMAFGLAAGFVVARAERIETLQTWPLAVRAGLEAPGVSPEEESEEKSEEEGQEESEEEHHV